LGCFRKSPESKFLFSTLRIIRELSGRVDLNHAKKKKP